MNDDTATAPFLLRLEPLSSSESPRTAIDRLHAIGQRLRLNVIASVNDADAWIILGETADEAGERWRRDVAKEGGPRRAVLAIQCPACGAHSMTPCMASAAAIRSAVCLARVEAAQG